MSVSSHVEMASSHIIPRLFNMQLHSINPNHLIHWELNLCFLHTHQNQHKIFDNKIEHF
jgi:hypothetical protein